MEKAAFVLGSYVFSKVNFDLSKIHSNDEELQIEIRPGGVMDEEKGEYALSMSLSVMSGEQVFIFIQCEATFLFGRSLCISEIPSFFYANAIAIVFPYIRAFVSNLTLQANVHPFVLPTYNLSSLQSVLKEHTAKKMK